MSYLDEIDDPRKPSNGTLHDFREILVILIAAVLSDCDTVEDITFWARTKEAWLRRFLVLKNGIPSEETFLRILRALDPKQFENMFRRWVGGVVGALSDDAGLAGTIAIDGKTVRGSGTGGESAIHMVSAFATELGLVLGQEKVAAKSNEITAIPEPLEAPVDKGLLVTIDAMGCQKSIAKQIVAKKGRLPADGQGQPAHAARSDRDRLHRPARCRVGRPQHAGRAWRPRRTVGQIASVLSSKDIVDPADWPKCRHDRAHRLHAGVVGERIRSGAALLHQLARPHRRATGHRSPCALGRGEPASGSSTSASARTPAQWLRTMRRRTCRCCARSR